MIKVGIVGGTGYTGVELLRLLARHPQVELKAITSRKEAGMPVAEMFPNLRGRVKLAFSTPEEAGLEQCDVVFFATPNGVAMQQTRALLDAGVKVIDLAADFRIKDIAVWEKWYKMEHACPDLVAEAVYGLPELNRDKIRGARLIANPGCYPTAVQRPEIKQGLDGFAGKPVGFTFVPHLTPLIRGIHATLYAKMSADVDLQALFEKRYAGEAFVDVMPAGAHPETRSVRGANVCRIAVHRPQGGDTVVVLSVIDNLVKGAAGQAVQNMNILFDLPEDTALADVGMLP